MSASDDCDGFVESTCISRVSTVAVANCYWHENSQLIENRAFEQFGGYDKCGHSYLPNIVST